MAYEPKYKTVRVDTGSTVLIMRVVDEKDERRYELSRAKRALALAERNQRIDWDEQVAICERDIKRLKARMP